VICQYKEAREAVNVCMGSREEVGVQRKLEGLMGWVFGGIFETIGSFSPIFSPSRLGTEPAFAFGMTCGAEKWL